MLRIPFLVIAVGITLTSWSITSAQTGVDAPDVAPRQTDFLIELDASRSFAITGVLVWANGGPYVDSAEVHVGGESVELEVVPPAAYVALGPAGQGLATPMAAFDVYELSDDLIAIIGDSTFGDKPGPFEPCFAALEPQEQSDASGWVSRVAFGLWGTAQVFDLIMPDLTPKPVAGTQLENVLPQYTCFLQIEPGDEPHRFPGILPDLKPVIYEIVQKKSGEIEVAVICPEEVTGLGESISVCATALPLTSPGGPPGNTPTFTAAIFRAFVSTVFPPP